MESNNKGSYTIGVLIGNMTSPHTMSVVNGLYHSSKELNVTLLFFLGIHSNGIYEEVFGTDPSTDYEYQFNTVYDYIKLGRLDALIISYGSLGIFLEEPKERFMMRFAGIPHVIMEEREEGESASYIIADNYKGMYDCVEHLIMEHGYQKILYLGGPKDNTDAEERKQAYLDVMEQYDLEVTEKMMEEGDYSEYVRPQIKKLLDDNPDASALVCANDIMATVAYRECERRGLHIGSDIAITGFDDMELAETMDPPLTTVRQNGYDMGVKALLYAIDLCRGGKPKGFLYPVTMKKRQSCGCVKHKNTTDILMGEITPDNVSEYTREATLQMIENILITTDSDKLHLDVYSELYPLIEKLVKLRCYEDLAIMSVEDFRNQFKKLINGAVGKKIMLEAFSSELFTLISRMQINTKLSKISSYLLVMLREAQTYLMSVQFQAGRRNLQEFHKDICFMPLIARDMINDSDDEKKMFYGIIKKLAAIKTQNAYIYLLKHPVINTLRDEWKCPDRLYLAAYHEGTRMVSYEPEARPVVTAENGFISMMHDKSQKSLFFFNIFSAERLYGLLVVEIEPEDILLLYFATMQIGTSLRHMEINHKQKNTQRKLEKSLAIIEDKNEVLNLLSEYDELTNCFNRRGFIERALTFNKKYVGDEAVLIFGDLDHLKEINDCFGHVEGDYAIECIGTVFRQCYEGEHVVGRIGGDEFVLLMVNAGEETALEVIDKIKAAFADINEKSGKPYYVEASMGFTVFSFKKELMINDIMEKADQELYEEKKKRRKSIRRD